MPNLGQVYDEVIEVAQATQMLARIVLPFSQMGDRAVIGKVIAGLEQVIGKRALSEPATLVAEPPKPKHDAGKVISDALAVVRRIAEAHPVQCIAVDRFGTDPVNRCRYCLARAPEVEALWTDIAWHGIDGSCLYVVATELIARVRP